MLSTCYEWKTKHIINLLRVEMPKVMKNKALHFQRFCNSSFSFFLGLLFIKRKKYISKDHENTTLLWLKQYFDVRQWNAKLISHGDNIVIYIDILYGDEFLLLDNPKMLSIYLFLSFYLSVCFVRLYAMMKGLVCEQWNANER